MRGWAQLWILIVAMSVVVGARAETLEPLINAGELQVRLVLESEQPHYQKAPLVLALEVGSVHRFKRGIRLRDFTVPGVLVSTISALPFNETRRINGDAWAFQTLRFTLYPEQTGRLQLPELTALIALEIDSQATAEQNTISGEIDLGLPALTIETTPGTQGLAAWLAADDVQVQESWQGSLETYQVGDAVTRTRRVVIKGAPAMVIPAFPELSISGLEIYNAPALVKDNRVGNTLEGVREERQVLTFESGGRFTIAEDQVYWFNLKTQALETITLPGRTLEVAGFNPAQMAEDSGLVESVKSRNVYYGLLVVVGALFSYVFLRWCYQVLWLKLLSDQYARWCEQRRMTAAYMSAAIGQDSQRCVSLLYQRMHQGMHQRLHQRMYERMSAQNRWQLASAFAFDESLNAVANALLAHAYGKGQAPEPNDLKKLWLVSTVSEKKPTLFSRLSLNPRASRL